MPIGAWPGSESALLSDELSLPVVTDDHDLNNHPYFFWALAPVSRLACFAFSHSKELLALNASPN